MNNPDKSNGVWVSTSELLHLRGAAESLGLSSHRIITQNMNGAHASTIRGRGMEFDEVRLYQPGDDVQRIDWRVTSRTGKTYTKLFKEERQRPIYVVVDQRTPMFFGSSVAFKSVVAARLAGLFAWGGLIHQDKVGGVIFGDKDYEFLKALSGKRGVLRLLHSLAKKSHALVTEEASPTPLAFNSILHDLIAAVHPGSLLVLISDFHDFDETSLHYLKLLKSRCDIVCFNIHDPLEQSLPPANIYGMSDGKQEMIIDTRLSSLREKFASDFAQHSQELYEKCAKIGISLIHLSTSEDLTSSLARVFGAGAKKFGRRP